MTDDELHVQTGSVPNCEIPPPPDDAGGESPDSGQAQPSPSATALQDERDKYFDLLLRKTAEFDNYRKRIERERRVQGDRAAADVLLDLLPIVDDLERALKAGATEEHAGAYRKGVELIYRQVQDLLTRRGVKAIEALGADFDPHLHQAVVSDTAQDRRDGEVIEELRRGYLIGNRLLRPAMVKVARW